MRAHRQAGEAALAALVVIGAADRLAAGVAAQAAVVVLHRLTQLNPVNTMEVVLKSPLFRPSQ
eukprot:COSAG02_NODE_3789_length_6229_cov_3.678630_6_plen_63_part_00